MYDSAVEKTTAAVAEGRGLDEVAQQLAADSGMDLDKARAYVREGSAYYAEIVDADMERSGIPEGQLQDFYAHLRIERAPELAFAIKRLTGYRDISGFRRLATEWQMLKAGKR